MLLYANKARSALTGSVTSGSGQVAPITSGSGGLFVDVNGTPTSPNNPMRCVITGVDVNGNDSGSFEIVEVTRSADNLTLINRGLEGTAPSAWSIGSIIECRPTAQTSWKGSRVLFSGGPLTDITGGTSTYPAMTIPAGMLVPGDLIRVNAMWYHKTGSYAYAPRTGLTFNGADVVTQQAVWISTEHTLFQQAYITIDSTTLGFVAGLATRENGATGGSAAQGSIVINTAASQDLVFNYRFDSGGETICLATYCVELVRG